MDPKALELAAMQMYGTFARISDPRTLEYRWRRMMPATRDAFIREAEIAIRTYRAYQTMTGDEW